MRRADEWGEEMKDTIYREDAIKAINLRVRIPHDVVSAQYASMAINAIRSVPPADRPQGKWKRGIVDYGFNADWKCSECGYKVFTDFVGFNYRPNCGCRMKGADDE